MAKKKTSSKKSSTKKAPAKTSAKKSASKSATTKKTTKKAVTKKSSSKKVASKKVATKKTTTKKTASKKTTSKKPATKKAPASTKKSSTKKPTKKTTKKTVSKADQEAAEMAAAKKAAEKKIADAKAADAKKNSGRKGITIVDDKPKRRSGSSKPTKMLGPPPGTGLLNTKRKPLISSGPGAAPANHVASEESEDTKNKKKPKTPFNKRELDKFRAILLTKRAELVGDVATMERGVLSLGDKGGDPATDVAEQGSDAYDQSLSIGLAEVDRKLIREIDDAIERIETKVYGLCEMTGKPIAVKRLEELPWTRLSIEAARELERRGS